MAQKKGNCKFDGCDNPIEVVHLDCCRTCYSGLRYWRDRPLAEKRVRLQQIERLNSRMEYMIVGNQQPRRKQTGNVTHISKRRKQG